MLIVKKYYCLCRYNHENFVKVTNVIKTRQARLLRLLSDEHA